MAQFLTKATGLRYEVMVSPDDSAFVGSDEAEQVVRDTAIIVNADTVRPLDAGGYIATTYDRVDAADGTKVRSKEHAYGAIEEIDGRLQVPLVSLHFVPNFFSSDEAGWGYKSQWTEEVGSFMNRTSPRSQLHVPTIAGDFNNRRCMHPSPETYNCQTFPFWGTLTAELDYYDSVS